MALTLRWIDSTTLKVDGECLGPATLGRSAAEVARLPVRVGNGQAEVGELFEVEGDGSDGEVAFEGDLRSVRDLAQGMKSGRVVVRGDAGDGLGAEMAGGSIEVEGSAGGLARGGDGRAVRSGSGGMRGTSRARPCRGRGWGCGTG